MNKFSKELIESLTEACEHAEGKPQRGPSSCGRSARCARHPPTIADVPTGIRPRLPHPASDLEELGTGPPPAGRASGGLSPSHRQASARGAGSAGVLKLARGFSTAHWRCTTETIANCSCFYFVVPAKAGTQSSGASSLALGPRFRGGDGEDQVAQHRDREQSRRPHRPIRPLELAGEAGGRHDIAGAPDARAAALAMGDKHRLAEARGDRRADMDRQSQQKGAQLPNAPRYDYEL